MNVSRRLIGWLTSESPRRSHGLQVFTGGGGGALADHLAEAQQRSRPGRGVQVAPALVQETIAFLRALAAEIPSPYVVSFASGRGWRAEMRLAVQSGRLVVSELHVTPEQPSHISPGGITARALRQVPLHARVAAFAEMLRMPSRREQVEAMLVGTGLEEMLGAQLGDRSARSTPKRTGRRALQTETLLSVASAYTNAVAAGSVRPVEDAAAALDMKMVRVRDLVHKARGRGLLSPASQGTAGGELTPHAKALLKQQRRKPGPRSRRRPR